MAQDPMRVSPAGDLKERRRRVEERVRALGSPAARTVPPEGRLERNEDFAGLAAALVDLGPVFASFGRYLSTRVDLLSRRECRELDTLVSPVGVMGQAEVAALVEHELIAPVARHFFAFNFEARSATLWSQRHEAWLAPDAAVIVTLARPDAEGLIARDLPLLPLLAEVLDVPRRALASAADDFAQTVPRRIDLLAQAAGFLRLADDRRAGGVLDAPVCYRDYCTAGMLTLERIQEGTPLDAIVAEQPTRFTRPERELVAERVVDAWLRQALAGRVVPYDFGPLDVRVTTERVVLLDAAFEAQTSAGQSQFFAYLNAVAAADPDAAWAWIARAAAAEHGAENEEELRRRLRQAVPFREGEWSGDERLVEQALVQWRVTREAGWQLHPHQLHMFRGLQAAASAVEPLAAGRDSLLAALESERFRMGASELRGFADVREWPGALDRLAREVVSLPQKLDEALTLASEGRLNVKLTVPEAPETQRVRNRTVALVVSLIAFAAVALLLRSAAPGYSVWADRGGTVLLLVLGAWLLIAAARL